MVSLIGKLTQTLEVLPTDETARLETLADIRAVIFDVYGTLLISAAGDVGSAAETSEEPMVEALHAEGIVTSPTMELAAGMERLIRQDHALAEATGTAHPEVEIRDIWKRILAESRLSLPDEALERVALRHECVANPVWPMPGASDLLAFLNQRELPLGILSNAQFYTPLLLEALLEKPLPDLGFREDLCLWSYLLGQAKPSSEPFAQLKGLLGKEAIAPEQVLYVGNDMRNDIAPAAAQGFKTALFAGDARSLRWREDDNLGVQPDIVLTELLQLQRCLA